MDPPGNNCDSAVTRRVVLGSSACVFGGTIAGCLSRAATSVTLLAAGSLAQTVESYVGPAIEAELGIDVRGEYYGTNALMRMIEDRTKHPDVVVSADATLLRDRLYDEFTDWDVEFATNSVGIGYTDASPFGRRLEAGEPWYELVREAAPGEFAISDPNLDPLGYRAVQAFALAEAKYGLDGFREAMLDIVYMEPEEPQLLTGVESGARAGAIAYRNMALDHGISFYEFPDAYNFANPNLADHYETVEYTTDEEEYTAVGRPVIYNATVLDDADEPSAGDEVVQFLIDHPDQLREAGLTVASGIPRSVGTVPESLDL